MITLVLGGARSGKSAVAERIATAAGLPVTYVATMEPGDDPDLAQRIAAHRARRPAHWTTVDAGDDPAATLRSLGGLAILDGLGALVARGRLDAGALCAALTGRPGDAVVVSEEVGLGVHPSSAAGRSFRDELGLVNQELATVADEVLLVVAGRTLRLER